MPTLQVPTQQVNIRSSYGAPPWSLDRGHGLAVRIAVGALAGLALAVLAGLPPVQPEHGMSGERLSLPESATAPSALDGHGKWGGYTR